MIAPTPQSTKLVLNFEHFESNFFENVDDFKLVLGYMVNTQVLREEYAQFARELLGNSIAPELELKQIQFFVDNVCQKVGIS